MIIQHNISALNANRQLNIVQKTGSKSVEKLSSGYRINRAADDAAGLSISEKMRRQIRGITKAGENVEDGISLCQVADGAMAEMHDMTNRMNELCVQAANGTNSADDRAYIQMEIDSIVKEFGRIINTTKFNEVYVFKGDEAFEAAPGSAVEYVPSGTGIGAVKGITAYQGDNLGDTLGVEIKAPDWVSTKYSMKDVTETPTLSGDFPARSDRRCAWIDFTNFKADSKEEFVKKLSGQGWDWACCYCSLHGCVTFVPGSTGVGKAETVSSRGVDIAYEYLNLGSTVGNRSDEIVKIDLNSIWEKYKAGSTPLGETICETLIDVLDHAGDPARHAGSLLTRDFVAHTYKKGTGKIYLIDSSTPALDPDGDESKFSATPRNDAGEIIPAEKGESVPVPPKVEPIHTKQLAIHAGTDADGTNKVIMRMPTFTTKNLTINAVSVLTEDLATNSINVLTDVLHVISANRSRIGAYQNRLEHTSLNLDNIVENTTDAESKIRDTDMADEMVRYSNNSILTQAGQSMLSQANSRPQGVLSLLSA